MHDIRYYLSYLVASSSTSSVFPCRSCTALPVLYPFPLPLGTPCPDCTRLSCFSIWATWRRSCCHLLVASSSLVLASSTLTMRKDLVSLSSIKLIQKSFIKVSTKSSKWTYSHENIEILVSLHANSLQTRLAFGKQTACKLNYSTLLHPKETDRTEV